MHDLGIDRLITYLCIWQCFALIGWRRILHSLSCSLISFWKIIIFIFRGIGEELNSSLSLRRLKSEEPSGESHLNYGMFTCSCCVGAP